MIDKNTALPADFLRNIIEIMHKDPGGRGLLKGPFKDNTEDLMPFLAALKRAILITGFPVRRFDEKMAGETDGPSGIANIAWALEEMGASLIPLTDEICFPQLEAALRARGCRSLPVMIPAEGTEAFLSDLFRNFAPTHLITLERPGKARDGHFYNMRGGIIDSMISDADAIMALARQAGAKILSVGDGGNELGMGALRPLVEERVPHGALICAEEAADAALVAGVSNWWGWGIAAFASLMSGRDLLPSADTERDMLKAVIASGGADGVTGLPEESVDGLSIEEHLAVLEEIRHVLRISKAERASSRIFAGSRKNREVKNDLYKPL